MKIAEYVVAAAPAQLVAIGLGSCVAIVLHDAQAHIGALAHVLLPAPAHAAAPSLKSGQVAAATSTGTPTPAEVSQPGRVPATAVPRMLDEMRALGARGPITARLVGGASLFGPLLASGGVTVGARNVEAARTALQTARVRVTGDLVGGSAGRSVFFDVATGRVEVRSMREGNRVL